MTYSLDFRWRIVSLIHVYDIDCDFLSDVFGPKRRTIHRWYEIFRERGLVEENNQVPPIRTSSWPEEVLARVGEYCKSRPTFYLEDLKEMLKREFPDLTNISLSTICRALNFDLRLTRKVIAKAAREAAPAEIRDYEAQLRAIYSFPEQLVFIDELSKDGRHAYRRYTRSKKGMKAAVKLPCSGGKELSVLAALNFTGFVAWESTRGTFTRHEFHEAFCKMIIPKLNPWPFPNSIVIMDNAKMHMYRELENAVHQTGARLLFLPPYAPELNPIEACFGRLQRWIQRNANLMFPLYPELVLEVAMRKCTRDSEDGAIGAYAHCGYKPYGIEENAFDQDCSDSCNNEF
ncbi:transposase [Nitzschia inconspicua]|uniref:Transposase n=1 Tax=Nitzschia inconspicua TaxID=303405 RepID=A0A9K3LRX9_9STRA|nr:transposase [Nitzschia inconspicua]